MTEQQRHEMVWEGSLPSGAEEWSCPICGRRTLISWEPEFKRTVLKAGNSFAIHSAVKDDLSIDSLQVDAVDTPAAGENSKGSNEDPRLGPWMDWLDRVGFENLWNDDTQ